MNEHMTTLIIVFVVVLVIVAVVRLYNRAVRVDRLHHRVLGARATLDAMLLYRATAVLEMLSTGVFDGEDKQRLTLAAQQVLHCQLPIVEDNLEPDDERTDMPPVSWGSKLNLRVTSAKIEHGEGTHDAMRERESSHNSPRVTQENALTTLIHTMLTPEVRQRATAKPAQAQAIENLDRAMYRLNLAMSFHNMHVLQAQRIRASWDARLFHLAGHAPMPQQCHLALDHPGELPQ
ncbi:hypothetical protein [Actinomyces vulturis]|uniref:hypothetical protein n=1 Tax=Actinomyces vulturis TaxID=1857645 RepID=UPI00082CB7DF|nr:hypothetical protein [Actinomyces vulturis]